MELRDKMRDESGIALIAAILVTLTVAAVAVGAALMSSGARSISRYNERLSTLEAAAEAGIEEVRSAINGNKNLYPDTLYNTIENGVAVTDASGATIPNVRRYSYVGPTGITSGQYGVFGSIVSVIEDEYGNKLVRRGEVVQESFAKYAYFTTIEGNIWFGGNDQIWGPVHTNDRMQIHYTGATFHSTVETASYIRYPGNGTFMQGYTEYGANIPMPETADLLKLQVQAQAGNTYFVGNTSGGHGEGTTRLEFMVFDLNNDGDSTDANEGFFRVYQSLSDPNWVSGDDTDSYALIGGNSDLCGDYDGGVFVPASAHPSSGGHTWYDALRAPSRRCYLGGADSLWGSFQPNDGRGQWLQWPGSISPLVTAKRSAVGDAGYLFPITRELNPSFKGVIFVQGKVVVSGTVRGQITIAATDDIIIGDDLVYASDPGAGTCADMVGLFSGDDIVIADNPINAPARPYSGQSYRTYDETTGEFIHGVVLALNNFTVENYNSGSTTAQPCEGTTNGRGCIYLTGGIIQRQRGAVGLTSGQGYIKRYSYDNCVLSNPPPYFPTTGHFDRGRIYEVDPAGFDVDQYFRLLTPH